MGEVPAEVVWELGFIYGPILMLFYFLALGSISYYQITRRGHDERVSELQSDTSGSTT